MEEVIRVEAEWRTYTLENGISVRGSGGSAHEQAYWSYVKSKHAILVQTWKSFDAAKSLVHILQAFGIWDVVRLRLNATMNFLDVRLSNVSVIEAITASNS